MKIVHLSDLHLGKRVNEFSMIEDQKYILDEIIKIIDEESPNCVIIAGDVYDKSIPPVEAVSLLDDFLNLLNKRNLPVFIISGNHDSAQRLAFGNKIMEESKIFVAPAYDGNIKPIILYDEFGPVNFYLLPFVKPAIVRSIVPDSKIESYTDAVNAAIGLMNIDKTERNILIAHQFVTGASTCDSEEISVGGLDNVDASVFKDFDYVALGHIHGPQKVGSERIYYSGTPLKYSFSECNHKKSLSIISLYEKGCKNPSDKDKNIQGELFSENDSNENLYKNLCNFERKNIPLIPLRDMRELKGNYDDLMLKKNYENTNTEDYIHITLTDEEDVLNGFSRLQTVYKNLMKLDYDNIRTRNVNVINDGGNVENQTPLELFQQFYKLQNNKDLEKSQKEIISSLIEKIWEGEK